MGTSDPMTAHPASDLIAMAERERLREMLTGSECLRAEASRLGRSQAETLDGLLEIAARARAQQPEKEER